MMYIKKECQPSEQQYTAKVCRKYNIRRSAYRVTIISIRGLTAVLPII